MARRSRQSTLDQTLKAIVRRTTAELAQLVKRSIAAEVATLAASQGLSSSARAPRVARTRGSASRRARSRTRVDGAALEALLREQKGNVSAVARRLGKARLQIQRWIRRYQIDVESLRGLAAPERKKMDETRAAELGQLLRAHRGNVSAVARELGKARLQIQRWIKRYHIDVVSLRQPSPPPLAQLPLEPPSAAVPAGPEPVAATATN